MDAIKKSLSELNYHIEKTEGEGGEHHRLNEIKRLLHLIDRHPDDEQEYHRSLKEQLEEAVFHFDAKHHEFVTAMQSAITVLDNSGV